MGLDISYCENAEPYKGEVDSDGEPLSDYERVYVNPHFPNHCEYETGYYTADYSGQFRAGSYSGYSYWRNKLAGIMGYEYKINTHEFMGRKYDFKDHQVPASAPFEELINFSDCEGAIGTVYSKKLYKDFVDHEEIANESDDEYFREVYDLFKEAFRVASNNGFVLFH